jgi:hypothetical protein
MPLTAVLNLIGFVPRALFLEQMENDRESVSVFLLLSMLTISARFTPSLCKRFGSDDQASEFFAEIAHILIADEMWKTSLENAQAFFLLGMADWGKGDRDRSAINMGIAVRMAGVLRLHREETYKLDPNPSASDIVDAERARRTFWVIQNHDNLYTQQHLPVSFAKSDITTLLPASEADFAFGREPAARAALAGTKPAQKDPSLVLLPSRSLFATLVQVHDFWGIIAREYCYDEGTNTGIESQPWRHDSRYVKISDSLRQWEQNIPLQHRWSAWNLRGYKVEHVELAYLSIVSIMKLNHIVLRRLYLEVLIDQLALRRRDDGAPHEFWEQMSSELFSSVKELYEIIDAFFATRGSDEGFPAMLAFCVYICGSMSGYLVRYPTLCPKLAPTASQTLQRTLNILFTLEGKWPAISEWTSILRRSSQRHVTRLATSQTTPQPVHISQSISRYSIVPKTRTQDTGTDQGSAPSRVTAAQPGRDRSPVDRIAFQRPMRADAIPPLSPMNLPGLSDAAAEVARPRVSPCQRLDDAANMLPPTTFSNNEMLQDFSLPPLNAFDTFDDMSGYDMTDFVQGYIQLGFGDGCSTLPKYSSIS